MKNCTDCNFAEWSRAKNGRLHPSGDGFCKYPYKLPKLPASMYWLGHTEPIPKKRWINRREEFEEHCVYFRRKDD